MTASEFQKTFSENIKKYRILNNLTQQKLAELADISVGYLCSLESGKKWGTPETITKLSNALQISPEQLFSGLNKGKEKSMYEELMQLSSIIKQDIDNHISHLITTNTL